MAPVWTSPLPIAAILKGTAMHLGRTPFLALLAVVLATPAVAAPFHYRWSASSGLLPNQTCPFWTLIDNSAANAVLSGGVLTLATTSFASNNLGYEDNAPDIVVPNPWILEFRCRYVSGTSGHPAREAIQVVASTVSNVLVGVFIGPDVVKINSGDFTIGASANVDTNDGFHTYRITINGSSVGSAVQVHQDGVHILTGALYGLATPPARISWGEVSTITFGASEWLYFEHNGSNASCVTPARESSWGRVKSIYR
jgi:hypothetical protein